MASLIQELTFIEHDTQGREYHKVFPAGTPITESRAGADPKWASEIEAIEASIRHYARRGDPGFHCFYLDKRPRLLHRRFWDPTFANELAVTASKTAKLNGYERRGSNAEVKSLLSGVASALEEFGGESQNRVDVVSSGGANEVGDGGVFSGISGGDSDGSARGQGDRADTGGDRGGVGLNYGIVVVVDLMNLLVRAFHAGPPSRINGVRSLLQTAANIIERLSPEYVLFAADGGHVARSELFADYKAHRPPKPDELVAQIELAERAIVAIGWPLIRVRGWEADDVIASIASTVGPRSAGVIVASCDKDLLQLCQHGSGVKVYHPWGEGAFLGAKHVEEKYHVTREQFGDYLALVGDASDGVPGVSGIGPKKAAELLAKYQNLDAILEAARCLSVPGAVGKALREQSDAARMSRMLIELNRGLIIPTTWHDSPATSPAAGWVESLRRMDLGQAARRLSEVLPTTGRVRSGTSLIEVAHDCVSTLPTVPGCGGVCSAVPAVQSTTERRDLAAVACGSDSNVADRPVEGDADSVDLAGQVEESSVAVPSGTVSDFGWIETFPILARLPKGAPWVDSCRSTYCDAYRIWKAGQADGCVSHWKPESDLHFCFQLGLRGLSFAMPERVDLANDLTSAAVPVAAADLIPAPAGSLF